MVRSTSPYFSYPAIRHLIFLFGADISIISEEGQLSPNYEKPSGGLSLSSTPELIWQSSYRFADNKSNFWCLELNELHPTLGDSSKRFVEQGRDELYLLPAPVRPWGLRPAWGGERLTTGFARQALNPAGIWLRKQHHGCFSFQSKGLKKSRPPTEQ